MLIEIIRIEKGLSTFGVMRINSKAFCVTCELPDKQNMKQISCIPEGSYKVEQTRSPKFGLTYKVLDVENRSEILFHKGNTINDSHGCILLGTGFGAINGLRGIVASGQAFDRFLNTLEGLTDITLEIKSI